MLGLLLLLSIALTLLVALLTFVLVREMVRPPRHTVGYALARGMAADPGELGLTFEEWSLDRPDGTKLAVWEVQGARRTRFSELERGPASQAVQSAPLTGIFVHGWGHSRIDALARVKPFVPLFDRIVLYDLRGHGDSTGLSRLGHDEHLDLLALIEQLGQGRYVLIGHSMGAVIALNAAAQWERSASRRDADAAAGPECGQTAVHDAERYGARIVGVIAYGPYCEFRTSLQGRLKVAGYPARPISDLALLVHRVLGLRPACVYEDAVARITCPLLVIHGVDDLVSPLTHAKRIVAAARDARLIEIENSAHLDAHLVDAERHDAIVREFIERVERESDRPMPAQQQHPGVATPGR